VNSDIEQEVHRRGGGRCEYCRVLRSAYVTPFQIDHIIARKHGGSDVLTNLASACYHCNLHKGPNIASLDPPGNGELVPPFNPRAQQWPDHFSWNGAEIVGQTPIGRATVRVLDMNDPAALAVRGSLMLQGVDFSA